MDTVIYSGLEAHNKCKEIIASRHEGDINYPLHMNTAGYWMAERGIYVAYDNSDGNCWMEEFRTLEAAKAWAMCLDESLWGKDKLT